MSHALGAICDTHRVVLVDDTTCPETGCPGGHGSTYVPHTDACPGDSR